MKGANKILSQRYEEYWSLTLEYSDIYGEQFNFTLNYIVNYIDIYQYNIVYNNELQKIYNELQKDLMIIYKKVDMASVRKSINQFIKLGFINPGLYSYHSKTKKFLNEKNIERKKILFSEIVYSNASLRSSVTKKSEEKEINFFIKTLEHNRKLTNDDIMALMTTVPSHYPKGFLTKEELKNIYSVYYINDFQKRKYNQKNYIMKVFKMLEGVEYSNKMFTFSGENDVEDERIYNQTKRRDNYLQKLYKDQLKNESKSVFGIQKCMISEVPYYAMIASHIKPFNCSQSIEEYDPQNGLLLGKDLDFLFDQGYITIANDGKVLTSNHLNKEIKIYHRLQYVYLNRYFLTPERLTYLNFHRENIFKRGLATYSSS